MNIGGNDILAPMFEGDYNLVMSLKTDPSGTPIGNQLFINLTVENVYDASILVAQNLTINVKPGETRCTGSVRFKHKGELPWPANASIFQMDCLDTPLFLDH